jgi:DNA-binding PadR family transcriptional regulator
MAKKNTTVYIILGLLNHEDLSGYDIKKKIDYMISNFWDVGYGQIYPTLKSMVQENLIEKKSAGKDKGPEKLIYSIKEEGTLVLQQWLELPEAKEYVKYEILLKLFFGSTLKTEDNIKRIESFRNTHQDSLKLMGLFSENLKQVIQEDDDHLYYYLTVLFGEQIYKAYLNWSDMAIKLLEERQSKLKT